MSEFMFRNLSVKLFPAAGEARQACRDGPATQACSPCTQLCTGTIPPRCEHGCTIEPSIPIVIDPVCRSPVSTPGFVDTTTNIILPAGDLRTELAALKDALRRSLAVVEAGEQNLEAPAKPTSVEEIDRLKSHLLDAVAELDERRAGMQGEGSAPDPG